MSNRAMLCVFIGIMIFVIASAVAPFHIFSQLLNRDLNAAHAAATKK